MSPPWGPLLLLALPFFLLAVGLAVASAVIDDYWRSFDFVIYAALAAGAGVLVTVGSGTSSGRIGPHR